MKKQSKEYYKEQYNLYKELYMEAMALYQANKDIEDMLVQSLRYMKEDMRDLTMRGYINNTLERFHAMRLIGSRKISSEDVKEDTTTPFGVGWGELSYKQL